MIDFGRTACSLSERTDTQSRLNHPLLSCSLRMKLDVAEVTLCAR
jgi:hypothetical protein